MHCPNCRSTLPAGSRFCNACGSSIGGSGFTNDRTQAFPPPQPTARPAGAPAPGPYNPASGQPYMPPPIPPAGATKKPIAALVAILLLTAVGVTAGTIAVMKSRKPAVVAGAMPDEPLGPGVAQSGTPGAPSGPGVVHGKPGRPLPPGSPVQSAPGKPGSPDMAPSVVMGPGSSAPNAPSVVQAPGVQTPSAPSVVYQPPTKGPGGAPVQGAPRSQPKPAPAVTGAPPVPQGRDSVDDYLRWLRWVEGQRQLVTARAASESAARYREFMDLLLGMASDDPSVDQRMMQMPQEAMRSFGAVQQAQVNFWIQMNNTNKPPVPADCRYLDNYYLSAGKIAIQMGRDLQVAMQRGDIGLIKRAASNQALVERNLSKANDELNKIRDVRRLPDDWMIQSGAGTSGSMPSIGIPGF
jgi:hypothetical protein